MSPGRADHATLGGWALITGGMLYFVFWLGPVSESDLSLLSSHRLQLAYYAVMILSIAVGLWSLARSRSAGGGRNLATVAAATAIAGLVSVVGLFAFGLMAMGANEMHSRRNRATGAAMVVGTVLWFILWSTGARFDSEGSVPLTLREQLMATTGLFLISGSLVAFGLVLLGRRLAPSPRLDESASPEC